MVISGCTLFLLLLAIRGSIQKSSPASLTYRAAVVELTSVFHKNDSAKTLNDNAEKFVGYIERAAEKGVDIIVFPELGLTSLVFVDRPHMASRSIMIPHPSQNYAPCNDSSFPVNQALKKIACAAEWYSIYVVVNLLEKEVCSGDDCPRDGMFLYVTSVVFDRKGKIVARGRKGHPRAELHLFNTQKTTELSFFDTDFGVTFGNIICFDIMYEEPWLILTRKLNITDIIYSAGWISDLPFLSTIQIEAGWAYAEDVNILASGHNMVKWGNSGSGIYAGRQGVVTAILPLRDHEELLVADVWKKSKITTAAAQMLNNNRAHRLRFPNKDHAHSEPNQGRDSHSFYWRYEKLDAFKTQIIANDGLTVQKLNHYGINCRFEVNITNMKPPVTYRFFAFDGVHSTENMTEFGTRICAITQCADNTTDSCGHIQNSSATFNFIAITAMYVDNMRTVMMPSTLGTDMLPIEKWTFKEYKHKKYISKTISLTRPTQNLVTFGVWGRNYEKDKINFEKDQTNSASKFFRQILYLPIFLILLENAFTRL